ncbi:MAG: hypothetical protein K0S48_3775 [Ramlibacter sp.]|jgi:hypothetical protein|nr:hypothetical protein [Ramlibacter sp.]MCE3271526.1 hypothetical protein [Ramlibacter sp.]
MIVVYWLERESPEAPAQARHAEFAEDALGAALQFAEQLRGRRAQGEAISHVAIQSELPQAVGKAGVSDPGADYAHYKRRIDPATPLGRPSGNAPKD